MIYETNNNYPDLVDIRYLVRMDILVIYSLLFVYIKSCATVECNKALSTTTYCEKPGYDKAEIPPNIPIIVEMGNSISVSMLIHLKLCIFKVEFLCSFWVESTIPLISYDFFNY